VAERVGFGNHYGTVYFKGSDATKMRDLLLEYEKADFYVADSPSERQDAAS
jgi:hypothetical protein